jgi:hypothetical protein
MWPDMAENYQVCPLITIFMDFGTLLAFPVGYLLTLALVEETCSGVIACGLINSDLICALITCGTAIFMVVQQTKEQPQLMCVKFVLGFFKLCFSLYAQGYCLSLDGGVLQLQWRLYSDQILMGFQGSTQYC